MGNGCHGGTWQESEKDVERASRRGEIWRPRPTIFIPFPCRTRGGHPRQRVRLPRTQERRPGGPVRGSERRIEANKHAVC